MASTLIATLLGDVREQLVESTAGFWTDAALMRHMSKAASDLWRAINQQYEDYFVTIDDTHVTLPKNTDRLSGVQTDVFRVRAVEPRVVGDANTNQGLIFKPRKYTDPEFVQARAASAVSPQSTIIFYAVLMQGAPVGAPVILVAPQVSVDVNLRLVYTQTIPEIVAAGGTDRNPIPGDSDAALVAYAVAWAKAKENPETGQRVPDAGWLAVYRTEKDNLVADLAPRSTQEAEVVPGLFQDMWPDYQ